MPISHRTEVLTGAGPHNGSYTNIKAVGGDATFIAIAEKDAISDTSSWSSDGTDTGSALRLLEGDLTPNGVIYSSITTITGTVMAEVVPAI